MSTKAFSKIKVYACLVAVAFLVVMFTLPLHMLTSLRNDMLELSDTLSDAVLAGDWDTARASSAAITTRFLRDKEYLKLFLDHEDLDSLEAAVRGVEKLAQVDDDAQLLYELEYIKNVSIYLKEIETFTLFNLF